MRSVRIDHARGTSGALHSSDVPVLAGVTYRASAWATTAEAAPGLTDIYLRFFDREGAEVGWALTRSSIGPAWREESVEATAPVGAVTAHVLLYSPVLGPGGTYYVDDVTLAIVIPV